MNYRHKPEYENDSHVHKTWSLCPLTIIAATFIMSLDKQHDEIFKHDRMRYLILTNTISLIVLRSVHDLFTHFSGLFLKLATRQTKCQEKQIQTISS